MLKFRLTAFSMFFVMMTTGCVSIDSQRGSSTFCSFYGESFCLALPRISSVKVHLGPDFNTYAISFFKGMSALIYEGDHPNLEEYSHRESSLIELNSESIRLTKTRIGSEQHILLERIAMPSPKYLVVIFPISDLFPSGNVFDILKLCSRDGDVLSC